MPRVLVAGGASFLGSSLCEALLLQNLEVICLDNYVTGKPENVFDLLDRPNFRLIEKNIRSVSLPKVDYIFHLAGVQEYLDGVDVSLETLEANSLGTRKLLEATHFFKAKFLLISAIDLYQGFLSKLSLEHYFGSNPDDARRFSHHEAKRFAEALVFEYFRKFKVDARIVRLADVYGPKMNLATGTALGELVTSAVLNEMLLIKGEGLTVIRPTFVDDVVYGLVKAMFNKGTSGKIYNLVNPTEATILQLAYGLQDLKPDLKLGFSKERETLKFPLSKAELLATQEELGWRPNVSLKKGLKATLDWFANLDEWREKTSELLAKRKKGLKQTKETLEEEIARLKDKREKNTREKKNQKEDREGKKEIRADDREEIEEKKEKKEKKKEDTEKEEEKEKESKEEKDEEGEENVEDKEESALVKIKSSEEVEEVEDEETGNEPVVVREFPFWEKIKRIGRKGRGIVKKPQISLPRPRRFSGRFSLPQFSLPRLSRPRLSRFSLTRKKIVFLVCFGILLVGTVYPLGSLAFYSFLGWENLKSFSQALEGQDIEKAKKSSAAATENFQRAKNSLGTTGWLASMVNKREEQARYNSLLTVAVDATSALNHASRASEFLLEAAKTITGSETGNLENSVSEAKLEIGLAEDKLSLAWGGIKNVDAAEFPSALNAPLALAQAEIPQARDKLATIRLALALVPEIVGLNENRTYLLLFQNNMELRPGGGFIGSYGLAHFVGGRLTQIKVEDVYAADGQLKEAVLPPKPIRDYLNQGNWYLRDSNWSAHFPSNAAQAEWFLDKSLGIKVDGVIALDISVLQKLLEVLGPIELVDYQETVDVKNVFERAEYHSEADFFPGSTQKRDFLGSLARTILKRVLGSEEEKWSQIVSAFTASLREKHMLVSLHHPEVKKIVAEENWDGAVAIEQKPLANELADYFMVVDANVGANKANFFIRREVHGLTVIDKDGGVAKRLTIVYQNQSPADTWPGGTYKNYLRVYVPSGSVFQEIWVDEVNDPGLVQKGRELGKTVFGVYFEVPIKSKVRIVFDYQLPSTMKFTNGVGVYSLLVQKQAGVIDDHLTATINYPSFYKIIKSEPVGKGEDQGIRYSTTLEEDRNFKLEFIK